VYVTCNGQMHERNRWVLHPSMRKAVDSYFRRTQVVAGAPLLSPSLPLSLSRSPLLLPPPPLFLSSCLSLSHAFSQSLSPQPKDSAVTEQMEILTFIVSP